MEKPWPTLDDFIASFTLEEQAEYERLSALADKEAEGLKQLRTMARCTQIQLAAELKTTRSNVSRIEAQADLYLSTLRKFVEGIGSTLELTVQLPGTGSIRLTGIGDLDPWEGEPDVEPEPKEASAAR